MAPLREIKTACIEFKADGDESLIAGFGATFEPKERHDWYGDIISPRAFVEDIQTRGPAAANEITFDWAHELPFGMFKSLVADHKVGDTHGLYLEGFPIDTRENEDRMKYVRAGALRGLSIGFYADEVRFLDFETPWGLPVREILKGTLVEISVVKNPANPFAQIEEVRDCKSWVQHKSGMWAPKASGRTFVDFGGIERRGLESIMEAADEAAQAIADLMDAIEQEMGDSGDMDATHRMGDDEEEEREAPTSEGADADDTHSRCDERRSTVQDSTDDEDDEGLVDVLLGAIEKHRECHNSRVNHG